MLDTNYRCALCRQGERGVSMTDAERARIERLEALVLKLSELERYRLGEIPTSRLTSRDRSGQLAALEEMVRRGAVRTAFTGTAADYLA